MPRSGAQLLITQLTKDVTSGRIVAAGRVHLEGAIDVERENNVMVWFPKIALAASMIFVNAGEASADRLLALGRHLAQECTACHRPDGASPGGIPSIFGLDPKYFTEVLRMYRSGQRTNPTMVSVAQSLDDEQIEALARYFASLPKPGGSVAAEKSGTAEQR